jgi:hypothetical protein
LGYFLLPILISAYVAHLRESGIRFHELRVQRSHENISKRTQTVIGLNQATNQYPFLPWHL